MDDNEVQHALKYGASIGGSNNVAYADSVRVWYPDRISVLADVDCVWHETYHKPGSADRLRGVSDRYNITGATHYLYDENDGWLNSDECDQFLSVARQRGLLVSLSLGTAWLMICVRLRSGSRASPFWFTISVRRIAPPAAPTSLRDLTGSWPVPRHRTY